MNKAFKQVALFLFIGVILLAIFQLNQPGRKDTFITYSEFIIQVEKGNVSKIIIENEKKIRGLYKHQEEMRDNEESLEKRFSSQEPLFDFWTVIPYNDADLMPMLLEKEVLVEGKDDDENAFWRSILSFLPWLIFFGLIWFLMFRQIQNTGNKALSFGKSRARLNPDTKNKVTFEDVAGVQEAKEELVEVVDFLKDPKKFITIGARIPTGVLLVGPPGTGKTLLARAVAGEAGVPFFSISGSDFVEMFVGVGASRVRDLFEQGKKNAPCIIFIDEIDAVGRLRGAGLGGGHDEREQTLNQLLVEMDGFEVNEGVIILAATNRSDVLDPALLRPGRFDRQVIVDTPDLRGREKILAVHSRKIPLSRDVDVSVIARGTPGFTGADLANLINEAALLAARRNKKRVGMIEMEDAKDKVLMGPERRSLLISDKEKKIIAYHEAGHTILGLLTGSDPVHKVTIIPRGRALGLTMSLPEEDKLLHSREHWFNQIIVLFGGYLAEKLIFGDITTGSSNDLERASAIARRMVTEWGMSDAIGPVTFSRQNEQIFLGREINQHRDYSDDTAKLIDREVAEIIGTCRSRAEKLLEDNRPRFEKIAEYLIERETLDAAEIKTIMDGGELPSMQSEPTVTMASKQEIQESIDEKSEEKNQNSSGDVTEE